MEDSHVESSEVKDARVRHAKAAAAAHEALLDAIHAAFGDSPPHGRLCVHWDGFGDHGCVDAVDWGFPDPAEEADAESLTCIIDEKAERPPSSVTEAAMNFVHRLIDFDRWLRDMEVGAGGDIAFILDCVSGRVSVSARRWVVKLRALDPRAERSWFLPVKKLEGEGFEEPRLGLDSGGAQAIAPPRARGVKIPARSHRGPLGAPPVGQACVGWPRGDLRFRQDGRQTLHPQFALPSTGSRDQRAGAGVGGLGDGRNR